MKTPKAITYFLFFILLSCNTSPTSIKAQETIELNPTKKPLSSARKKIVKAALSIVNPNIVYDPSYFSIKYPGGDVPKNKGVCTDVVIRTYRKLGVDLQKLVHEDMKKHFNVYPKKWGLKHTDTNIDHRRVPNLMKYFSRFGKKLPITQNPKNYLPGDIVVWNLGNNILHIGIVVDIFDNDSKTYKIVHNIGNGQIVENVLFDWKIIGHYFY